MRRSTWYWRIWWWIGYHGLYQYDWYLRRVDGRLYEALERVAGRPPSLEEFRP